MQVSLAAARQQVAGNLAIGDFEAALELIASLRERFPRDYRLSALKGQALLARGDLDQARTELQRAAAAAPEDRDVQLGLASCGVEEAALVAADLPPLSAAADGERPPISAAALGHLYLRQLLLTHCTAQLDPLWQTRGERLDIGSALAEAHWRLQEAEAAEEISRALLALQPDCLRANLILAQMLWVSGQRDAAAPLINRAQELDPENEVAEELYEWLTVRDTGLIPLRRREVLVDLPEPEPEPERQPVSEPEPVSEAEPELEPVLAEPEPSPVSGRGQGEGVEAPVAQIADQEPAPERAPEPEQPAPIEAVLAEPPTEPPAAEPAPFWEREPQEEPAPVYASSQDEEQQLPVQVVGAEPDLAETAPEPALATVEAVAAHPLSLVIEWVDVDRQGHLHSRAVAPGQAASQNGCVHTWTASCGMLSERLRLGRLRTSSVDSDHGALQVVHHGDRAVVALAPPGTNLGLIRARLRQSLDSSEERIPN